MTRCTLMLALALCALTLHVVTAAATPNFVVIFADDQDALQDTTHPRYMPNLDQYFVTTPVCCPSRTNLWRGQFSHNTNFTDVLPPYGGYAKWKALGIDKSYLPVWLQELGYNTYYVGKFIVDYSSQNYNDPPAGWTDIDALVMPFTFDYNLPTFSRNGAPPLQYPGTYSTDTIADKAVAQLQGAAAAGKPFYHQISIIAPHTSTSISVDPVTGVQTPFFYPPIPAPRHWGLFSDATLPENTPHHNLYEKDVSDKPAWIRALPLQVQANRTYLEESYRLRLRSLAAVDELIGRVFQTLINTSQLDNTYVIYTADNGYHVGTHRFGGAKTTSYEEDLRVPFLIRGPGIAPSTNKNSLVGLHVDFAPTLLSLAKGDITNKQLDGTPLGLYQNNNGGLPDTYPHPKQHRQQFQSEFWGTYQDEALHSLAIYPNNTWKSVRVWDENTRQGYKLIVSCTGERELYDLKADPGELRSQHNAPSLQRVRSRLEGLLAVLAVCKGDACVNPWKLLHPDSSVSNFWDALKHEYDDVYASVTPFEYVQCLPYQDLSNEVSQFRSQVSYKKHRRQLSHSHVSARRGELGAAAKQRSLASNRDLDTEPVTFVADVEKHAVPLPEDFQWDMEAYLPTMENRYHWA